MAFDVEGGQVGDLQHRDRLAHRLVLGHAGGVDEEGRTGGGGGQAVAGLAADLDEQGVDLLGAAGFLRRGLGERLSWRGAGWTAGGAESRGMGAVPSRDRGSG